MCQECRQTPCHPQCPNAPEPAVVWTCDNCGYEIREGETMWKFDLGIVCKECVERYKTFADLDDEW